MVWYPLHCTVGLKGGSSGHLIFHPFFQIFYVFFCINISTFGIFFFFIFTLVKFTFKLKKLKKYPNFQHENDLTFLYNLALIFRKNNLLRIFFSKFFIFTLSKCTFKLEKLKIPQFYFTFLIDLVMLFMGKKYSEMKKNNTFLIFMLAKCI